MRDSILPSALTMRWSAPDVLTAQDGMPTTTNAAPTPLTDAHAKPNAQQHSVNVLAPVTTPVARREHQLRGSSVHE